MIKNSLQALKMHLFKSVTNGSPSAILFAQFALFTATIFVWNTSSFAEYDSTGIKTVLSYQIISAVLVSNSRRLRGLGFIHRVCDSKVNSIANLIYLILAIVFEHFYEKSLSSLGFALSITVLFLILLVIIRPSTDLGLVDFLIGVIGSVAYGLFSLKFQTWIVVAICFLLLRFRCWLDKNCSQKEDAQSLHTCRSTKGRNQISKSEVIEAISVLCFHLFWVYNLFRTNCRKVIGPPESISCTSSPIMGMLVCVLIFNLWFGLALIPRVYSLFQTKTAAPFTGRPIGIQENGLGHMVFGAAKQGPGPEEQGPKPEEQGPSLEAQGPGPEEQGPEGLGLGPEEWGSNPKEQGPGPEEQCPRSEKQGPEPEEQGPRPEEQGPGPEEQCPRPAKQGLVLALMKKRPVQPLRHAFSQVGKGVHTGRPIGIQENGLGHMVFGAAEQGPGPEEQGPGPEEQGPSPEAQGPGPEEQGPEELGPNPKEQGPGPEEQCPRSEKQGPEHEEQGPGPEEQGPGPEEQCPRPVEQRPAKQGLGLALMKKRPVQPLRHAFSQLGKGVHGAEKKAQKNAKKGVNTVLNEMSKMRKGCKIFLNKTISL